MGECPRCSETAITDGFKEDKKLQREKKAFCQRVLEKHDLTIQQKRRVEIELADQKERQLTTADKDQPIFSNQVELTRLPVCGSGKEYRKNAVKHLSNLDLNLVQKHVSVNGTPHASNRLPSPHVGRTLKQYLVLK